MATEQAAWEPLDIQTPLQRLIGYLNQRLGRLMNLLNRLQRRNTRRVSAATTLTEADDIVLVDTSGGGVTLTLPSASATPKVRFTVKKISNDGNNVVVAASGSDTVDFGATKTWSSYLTSYDFESAIVTAPATWSWLVV